MAVNPNQGFDRIRRQGQGFVQPGGYVTSQQNPNAGVGPGMDPTSGKKALAKGFNRIRKQGRGFVQPGGYVTPQANPNAGSPPPPAATTAPPTGTAATAGGKGGKKPTGTPATGGAKGNQPPGYQAGLNTQFGAGNPFGMQSWYGGNPLQTAKDLANQNLGQQLGQLRTQFGQMGMGNSSRSALAQGTAAAQSATGLGDVLAQRGLGAYQSDADRGLAALLGAGQQDLAANQQLGNLGTGLTGIGSAEQQMPGMNAIAGLLSALAGQDLTQTFRQSGGGGYWT